MQELRRSFTNILVIEDEPVIGLFIQAELEDAGYRVVVAESGADAREALGEKCEGFEAVVVDLRLPDDSGERIITDVRAKRSELPILIATGADDLEDEPKDAHLRVLRKPYGGAELIKNVRALLH